MKNQAKADVKGNADQLKNVKPRVTKTWYQDNVKSILALSFNLHSLSYVQMTKDRTVYIILTAEIF